MPTDLVTRFAPSPTGRLHLGHAYSAFLNHDLARAREGQFLLRIEDIDQGRCRTEFETGILEDLEWLGLRPDGAIVRQSEHFERYENALAELAEAGLLYRCFRTRKELSAIASAPHGPEHAAASLGPLPREDEERRLAEDMPFAWRLNLSAALARTGEALPYREEDAAGAVAERTADLRLIGDVVLGRKDFPASYHLASVLDDARQGVTLVLRGEDLRDALPCHRLLQALFGLPAPTYRHHGPILDEDGNRLAKRNRAETLEALREAGADPAEIRRRLGLGPAA